MKVKDLLVFLRKKHGAQGTAINSLLDNSPITEDSVITPDNLGLNIVRPFVNKKLHEKIDLISELQALFRQEMVKDPATFFSNQHFQPHFSLYLSLLKEGFQSVDPGTNKLFKWDHLWDKEIIRKAFTYSHIRDSQGFIDILKTKRGIALIKDDIHQLITRSSTNTLATAQSTYDRISWVRQNRTLCKLIGWDKIKNINWEDFDSRQSSNKEYASYTATQCGQIGMLGEVFSAISLVTSLTVLGMESYNAFKSGNWLKTGITFAGAALTTLPIFGHSVGEIRKGGFGLTSMHHVLSSTISTITYCTLNSNEMMKASIVLRASSIVSDALAGAYWVYRDITNPHKGTVDCSIFHAPSL